MANKDYTWLFDLKENAITKDVKEDYVAKVASHCRGTHRVSGGYDCQYRQPD